MHTGESEKGEEYVVRPTIYWDSYHHTKAFNAPPPPPPTPHVNQPNTKQIGETTNRRGEITTSQKHSTATRSDSSNRIIITTALEHAIDIQQNESNRRMGIQMKTNLLSQKHKQKTNERRNKRTDKRMYLHWTHITLDTNSSLFFISIILCFFPLHTGD